MNESEPLTVKCELTWRWYILIWITYRAASASHGHQLNYFRGNSFGEGNSEARNASRLIRDPENVKSDAFPNSSPLPQQARRSHPEVSLFTKVMSTFWEVMISPLLSIITSLLCPPTHFEHTSIVNHHAQISLSLSRSLENIWVRKQTETSISDVYGRIFLAREMLQILSQCYFHPFPLCWQT